MAETNIKASLSLESVEALKKIVEIKQQLKAVGDQLKTAETGSKFDSEDAKKYGLEIEKLNIKLKDATTEFGKVAEKAGGLESFKTVLSGIQGGFKAVAGTLSLFGEKSEVVEKALGGIKTGLEITEGLSSLGKAVQAFKALGLAISTTGIGAFIFLIGGLIAAYKELNEEADNELQIQKKLEDIHVKAGQSAAKNVSQIQVLLSLAKDQNQTLEIRKNAIKTINDLMPKHIGNITLENLETDKSTKAIKDYIKQLNAKALAEAYQQELVELNKKLIEEQNKSADESLKWWQKAAVGIRAFYGDISGASENSIKMLDKNVSKQTALVKHQIDVIQQKLNADVASKNAVVQFSQDKQTAIANETESLYEQLKKQLIALSIQKEAEINLANDLGKNEEDIYNIQKNFLQLKLQALEQYYAQLKNKHSRHAVFIKNQITDIVKEGIQIDDKHIKAIFDATDAEIRRGFENFKQPAAIEPGPPESDEEKMRKERLAQDSEVRDKLKKRKEYLDLDKAKDKTESPYKKELSDLESFYTESKKMVIKKGETDLKLEKYYSEAKKRLKKQEVDYELHLTEDLLNQATNLFGKNTVAGKVTAVAAATINTYLGATKALATLPPPFSYVSAALTIATGIKNIQSIISTQVPGQGGSSGSAPSTPSSPIAPQVQQTNTTLNQDQLNQIGNATVRAFVLESDVSNNQEKIARLNRAARLGG